MCIQPHLPLLPLWSESVLISLRVCCSQTSHEVGRTCGIKRQANANAEYFPCPRHSAPQSAVSYLSRRRGNRRPPRGRSSRLRAFRADRITRPDEGPRSREPLYTTYEKVRVICLLQSLAKLTYLLSYSRLIDDVLSLSKLDSGMLVVTSVPCRPLSFTRDVLGMFEPELRSKSIAHSFSVLEGYRSLVPSCVKVDPQRVTQVVSRRRTSGRRF